MVKSHDSFDATTEAAILPAGQASGRYSEYQIMAILKASLLDRSKSLLSLGVERTNDLRCSKTTDETKVNLTAYFSKSSQRLGETETCFSGIAGC